MEQYIVPKGKQHLLKVGFLGNSDVSNFNYVALGIEGSNAVENKSVDSFREANGDNYERVQLVSESTIEDTENSISLSATFDATNFNPSSSGVKITEIGIVNQDISNSNDEWFAFLQVPTINKTSNMSLKYTIIISIE